MERSEDSKKDVYPIFEKLGNVIGKKFSESKSNFDNYFYKLLNSAKYEDGKLFVEIILRFVYLSGDDLEDLKREDVLSELNDVISNKNFNIALLSFMKGFYSR